MPVKYVNVVDPLLPSNNLGRSVSQGNAIRIRKAFKTGAARLSALRRDEGSRDEAEGVRVLEAFFGNALRHRRGTRSLPSAPKTPPCIVTILCAAVWLPMSVAPVPSVMSRHSYPRSLASRMVVCTQT